jgi:hypothetical protein
LAGAAMGMPRSTQDPDATADLGSIDYEGSKRSFAFEMKNAPLELRKVANEYFDKTFKRNIMKAVDALKAKSKYLSDALIFNLPRSLGGLGLDGEPSAHDLKIASFQILRGESMPKQEKGWLFHDKLGSLLREQRIRPTTLDCDVSYGPLYWFILSHYREKVMNQVNIEMRNSSCPEERKHIFYNQLDRQARWLRKFSRRIRRHNNILTIEEIRKHRSVSNFDIDYTDFSGPPPSVRRKCIDNMDVDWESVSGAPSKWSPDPTNINFIVDWVQDPFELCRGAL